MSTHGTYSIIKVVMPMIRPTSCEITEYSKLGLVELYKRASASYILKASKQKKIPPPLKNVNSNSLTTPTLTAL